MHEAEKLIQEIRSQLQTLQALLNYLESQGNWSEEDVRYAQNTLRRIARELIATSRGRLVTMDLTPSTQRNPRSTSSKRRKITVKRRGVFSALILSFGLIACPRPADASETDALLNKLIEKGILTSEEAQEVRNDMAKEAGPAAETRAVETKETVKKMRGGSWLDKVKWAGDLRLRHETVLREPATDRQRERMRLRFGFVANPFDPLEVGVRLATGASGDPLSTNQSFTATFDKKAIFVDQAYGRYTPWKGSENLLSTLSFIGGKMENPFVTTTEGIVWDSDVTPEGVAVQWKDPQPLPVVKELLPVRPFFNIGAFQISELNADSGDPAVFGFQGGADIDLPLGVGFQPSVTYYDFTAVQGIATSNITNSPGGNTTSSGRIVDDFDLVSTQAKITTPPIFGQPVALLGDYTYNTANKSPGDDTNVDDAGAYTYGIQVGKVTEKFGSWMAYLFHKRVESDSTFGALTDSDFGGGGTNHKGYIMGLQMGLNKWASIGVKYFRTDAIEGTHNPVDTFQADLQLKY